MRATFVGIAVTCKSSLGICSQWRKGEIVKGER